MRPLTPYRAALLRRLAVVYVHVGGDGNPIYVGVTNNLPARTRSHQISAPWWPQVTAVYAVTPPLPRAEAEAEEQALITRLDPAYNTRWTSRGPGIETRRVATRRQNTAERRALRSTA